MEDIFGGLVLLMGGFVSIFAIIALAVVILMIIANIFLFRKMGLPGWYSIIPFWNVYNQVSMESCSHIWPKRLKPKSSLCIAWYGRLVHRTPLLLGTGSSQYTPMVRQWEFP